MMESINSFIKDSFSVDFIEYGCNDCNNIKSVVDLKVDFFFSGKGNQCIKGRRFF